MADQVDPVAQTVAAAADAVTGPNTPDAVKVTRNEDWLTILSRALSGPAISAMLIFVIVILSFGTKLPWVGPIWGGVSEVVRANYVGGIGIALTVMLGILIWRSDGTKLGRLEVKIGSGSLTMGTDND